MSDVPSGARAPDANPGYRTQAYPAGAPATGDATGTPATRASTGVPHARESAGQAAGEVKDTAKQQARRVGDEARVQARRVAGDVRDRIAGQARTENDRLVSGIRQTADHLDEMRGVRQGTPAATVVARVADGGRQFADYLDRNGPEGLLRDVQDFARRRPGAFLATAVVAGFLVGRLGKGVAKASPDAGKPHTDAFVSDTGPGYPSAAGTDPDYTPAGTSAGYAPSPGDGYAPAAGEGFAGGAGYPPAAGGYADPGDPRHGTGTATEYAATGTGTPLVVEDDDDVVRREDRR